MSLEARVAEIRARHQLGEAPAEPLPASFEVVRIGDAIVKLVAARWRPQLEAERDALAIAGPALGALVPRLRASGELDGWGGYLVMDALPGIALGQAWSRLDGAARTRALHELGALLARLHALPIAGFGGVHADWDGFVIAQVAACAARQRAWGVAEPLVAEIPAFLVATDVRGAGPPALIHADATPDNVLVDPADGRITGLIDFGDARLADRAYDLITPALFSARGDPALLAALLDGVGLALDAELRARLMAHALIHPFNDLTRFYDIAGAHNARSLDELALVLFP